MPKKGYDLSFQPKEKRKRSQTLRLMFGFGAILLLLAIASVVALLRDDLVDQVRNAFNPTETTTEQPEDAWVYTGNASFLLCETDDNGQSLRFCALVRAELDGQQLHIFPFSPKAMAPYEGQERSLEQALRSGGIKELKAAVEAITESTIDRFISSGDDGFVKAANYMGSVTVQVEKRIRYRGADFTLTLAEGTQRLQGDMLLRYFRYLGTLKEDSSLAQGELLQRVLETYFSQPMDEKTLENCFNQLVNLLETDITATDFYTRQALLLAVSEKGSQFKMDVKE